MNTKERIKTYVKSIKMPVTSFERSIGASNGYVNGIYKSIGADKRDLIIVKYPNLNIDWLLTGRGEMLLNYSEKKISSSASDALKDKYILLLEKINSNFEEKIQSLEDTIAKLTKESSL